jgi:hypothetical protein
MPGRSSSPRTSAAPDGGDGDVEPPQTYVDVLAEGSAPSVTVGADEAASFECSIDGGAWTDCSSQLRLAGLGPGEHTLAVAATDEAGNTDPTPATATWEVGLR